MPESTGRASARGSSPSTFTSTASSSQNSGRLISTGISSWPSSLQPSRQTTSRRSSWPIWSSSIIRPLVDCSSDTSKIGRSIPFALPAMQGIFAEAVQHAKPLAGVDQPLQNSSAAVNLSPVSQTITGDCQQPAHQCQLEHCPAQPHCSTAPKQSRALRSAPMRGKLISHLARCRYAIEGPSGQGGRAH